MGWSSTLKICRQVAQLTVAMHSDRHAGSPLLAVPGPMSALAQLAARARGAHVRAVIATG